MLSAWNPVNKNLFPSTQIIGSYRRATSGQPKPSLHGYMVKTQKKCYEQIRLSPLSLKWQKQYTVSTCTYQKHVNHHRSIIQSVTLLIFIHSFIHSLRERKRGGETSMCQRNSHRFPLCTPLTGELAHIPGMCPDWESTNDFLVLRPAHNQSIETHHPGIIFF